MVRNAISLDSCEIGQKIQEKLNKELNKNLGLFQLTQICNFINLDAVDLPEEVALYIVKY